MFFIFAIKRNITHCSESQYDIQNNNFRKRLENTQKFTFDIVAFLFALRIFILYDPNRSYSNIGANEIFIQIKNILN